MTFFHPAVISYFRSIFEKRYYILDSKLSHLLNANITKRLAFSNYFMKANI